MASEIEAMGAHMLVGALAPTASEMLRSIEETLGWLARRTGTDDVMEMMARSAVRGFAVTPPRGASLAQDEIHAALDRVATSGVPLALYQLPQVTLNEMSAATVAALAARHPKIYLLKDSSGADRIALSGVRDLFLVRGAEGDYAAHLTASGGRYDGFLLSTANCFPRQLSALIVDVARGSRAEADRFSRALTAIMRELLPLAGRIGYGNAFASANKALDHFVAHGLRAAAVPPPRTHGGRRLPRELVVAAGEALGRHGLLPERGYL